MDIIALFSDPAAWLALLTLIALEVVLGVDNLIFIAILSNKLPEHQQQRARRIGLALALVMRIGLLMLIGWLVTLQTPLFDLGIEGAPNQYGEPSFETAFSGRDLILLAGGFFLLWKATKEIHHAMEPEEDSGDLLDKTPGAAVTATFGAVIAQIVAIDLVFSVDFDPDRRGHDGRYTHYGGRGCHHRGHYDGGCRSTGRVYREKPHPCHAGARLSGHDRRCPHRRWLRLPCPQGIYLRRDGFLRWG